MDKYEFHAKVRETGDTIKKYFPRILKSITEALSFIIYVIAILLTVITNLVVLGVLYIGVGITYLSEKIVKE